jgi:hypothetical protein
MASKREVFTREHLLFRRVKIKRASPYRQRETAVETHQEKMEMGEKP